MTSEFGFFVLPSLPTPPGVVVHSWGLLVRRFNGRNSSTKQGFPTAALKGWYLERPWYSYKWTIWKKCLPPIQQKCHPTPCPTTPWTTPWKHLTVTRGFCSVYGQIGNHFSPKVSKGQRMWLDNHVAFPLFDAWEKWTKRIIPTVGEKWWIPLDPNPLNKNHQRKHIQVEIGKESIKNLGNFHDVFPKIR